VRARTRAPFHARPSASLTVLAIVASSCSSATKPPPAPPVPIDNKTRTCAEAAVGLEQATRGIRSPETTIVQEMRGRCTDDSWPAKAIDCFATMQEGDLGKCALLLADDARRGMFAALGGGDETAIAVARIRLENMHVGVATCDRLFATARDLLSCDRIPIATRAVLGPQVADLWDLPTHGLPPDAQAKMTGVCQRTLDELQKEAFDLGCMF
jgi:hypothetical protein